MIGTNDLDQLVQLCLWSGYIEGERPVSMMLVANVESGKTEILRKYTLNKGVVWITDCTAFGLARQYANDFASGKIRHLMIADFITPLSKQTTTVQGLVTFLNGLLEEGISEIHTAFQNVSMPKGNPNGCGLITSIATKVLEDQRHNWSRIGFMSRMVPVSYEYKITTQHAILSSIAERSYHKDAPIVLPLPACAVRVEMEPKYATALIPYSTHLVAAEKLYGFRKQKQLQTLTMSSALSCGRDYVKQEDVDRIAQLCDYIGLDFRKV